MTATPNSYSAAFAQGWTPEPDDTVSEWADQHRVLSQVASSEPGQWRTDRTPYLREIMDSLSPSVRVRRVVVMAGAQVGKTESGNNWLGYIIHQAPAPTLMVLPTVEVAQRTSKQRIKPMLEGTPALAALVRSPRSRDSGNTIQMKEFRGGILMIVGANSGSGLRAMPVRNLFLDEVDEYPGDVDGQGDPVALAEKRTNTFPRAKILMTSTPTVKGWSRIEAEYLQSDQRRFYVPCPECGHMDWLRWENIRWPDGDPRAAYLVCVECGAQIAERHKTKMLAKGEWRATAKGDGRTRGYHVSGLYSPLGWKSWGDCAAEFIAAKNDPPKLKTWVNTVLGETWEERPDVQASKLRERCEHFEAEVPHGAGVLVAAVDVQADRLEAAVVAYGAGEESWLVAFQPIVGDPSGNKVWAELDSFLGQKFTHASGRKVGIELTVVDSGHHTEMVYRYAGKRLRKRVFAIKGGSITGQPLVSRPSRNNSYNLPMFVLCTDTGKDAVMSRLRIVSNGPGRIHLPHWVDDEFLEQLASERQERKWVKGKGTVRVWKQTRDRNEAFDLMVYALAALYICGNALLRSLPERAAKWSKGDDAPEGTQAAPDTMAALRLPRRRKGWVNNW